MIEYLILIMAIPLGLLGRYLTDYEKPIYRNYFKWLIPGVFLAGVVFAFTNEKQIFFTLTFSFLMLVVWNR